MLPAEPSQLARGLARRGPGAARRWIRSADEVKRELAQSRAAGRDRRRRRPRGRPPSARRSRATRGRRAFRATARSFVNTRDAVWAFELTQRAVEIAARLPNTPALKFAPGPLAEAAVEPPPEEPAPPLQATPEQALEAARWASAIEDEELRELVARAARASLARAAADRPF